MGKVKRLYEFLKKFSSFDSQTVNTVNKMTDNHAIFVGGKPFMNYVTAVVMQFTTKGADNVVISSRGKFISRAVDVAEVVKSRFLRDQIEVSDIKMGSEEFKNNEGRTVRVSTLDIYLDRIAKPIALTEEPTVEEPKVEAVVEKKEELAAAVVEEPAESEEEAEETEEE
jgi:archaea-specific DNA-binding protein